MNESVKIVDESIHIPPYLCNTYNRIQSDCLCGVKLAKLTEEISIGDLMPVTEYLKIPDNLLFDCNDVSWHGNPEPCQIDGRIFLTIS